MPVYHDLTNGDFFEDWSDTGRIASNDDWSRISSIVGYLGDDATTTTAGRDPAAITRDFATVDVIANLTSTANTSGGVAEFELANPTIALQGSGTADNPNLVLYLNAAGRQDVTVSFVARDLDGTADNAVQPIVVQYRTSATGEWVTLPAATIADATQGPSIAGGETPVTVTLPAAANGAATLEVRIMTANAPGNDEWVGIDDIRVTSEPAATLQPGTLSIGDASVVEGDDGVAYLEFTVTRDGGSDGAVGADWSLDFPGGTTGATAADLADGQALTGSVTFADGATSAVIRVAVRGDTAIEPDEQLTLTLANPGGGAALGDAVATGTIVTDEAGRIANVFFNEIHYDNSGTDVGEAVELAGEAGTDLTGWSVVFYNGNGGAPYGTVALSGVLADQGNGFGTIAVAPPAGGIQNGAPDGLALVDAQGRVVQFLSYEGTMTATAGPAAGLTSTDIGVAEEPAPGAGLSLQLVGSGSSAGDFTWVAGADDSFGAINGGQDFLSPTGPATLRVEDARVVEGSDGVTVLAVTVARAGGTATAGSVDYALGFGTADLADLAEGASLSGTVTFAPGEARTVITIPVVGDRVGEGNETLTVTLSNPSAGSTIGDGSATLTIVNDDPIVLDISAIQGAGHRSDYAGQLVTTGGIVTAVDTNGFYLQMATGDGDDATSDAIFVFTRTAPTVAVGDAASVTATVEEFQAGRTGLSVTQLTAPTVTVLSSGNALPEAVRIGEGGRLPPTEVIEDDGLTSFDPATDGLDFWESMEGMRVTIDAPQVVSNTNGFGETDVIASGGAGATGVADRGGITVSDGDFNPERIQIDDDAGVFAGFTPGYSIGDQLGDVTGVLGYSFDRYEVVVTEAVGVTVDTTLERETTGLVGDAAHVTFATYNVENLDPGDNRFDILASDILYALAAPDIVALQEVQDADGAGNGSDLSGQATAQGLIDAIAAAGGPQYIYVEVAPSAPGTTGGEPGGNIRNGFLYRADRVSLVEGSLGVITDPAFAGSRQPLVATFAFGSETFTAINVHLTSRGGSTNLMGGVQPPVTGGEDAREAQTAAIRAYVEARLADDPSLEFAVLGDFNAFYFEEALENLTGDGLFTNISSLAPDAERYSYLFDGNLQAIDHILLTGGLTLGAAWDAVHINAEFGDAGASDHDPQVVRLYFNQAPTALAIDGDTLAENAPAGTVVGTLTGTDTEGEALTYSLVDDADGLFVVDPATGVVTTTRAVDYETLSSAGLVARVTDAGGRSFERAITIAITDVAEAPAATGDALAIDEDATSANLWDQLLGNDTDPDAGAVLTITGVDTSATAGSVEFDAETRTLRYVADADAFDALAPGATATDSFTYTITDETGRTSTATVTVTVTGIADGVTRDGGNGRDLVDGTAGEDTLSGGRGNDVLRGLSGHDRLDGGQGADVLDGGSGNDVLIGGQGFDWLTGGAGRDSFVFGRGGGLDVVTDYDATEDSLVFEDGVSIARRFAIDYDRDGEGDTVLFLSNGGGVVVLIGEETQETLSWLRGQVGHDGLNYYL